MNEKLSYGKMRKDYLSIDQIEEDPIFDERPEQDILVENCKKAVIESLNDTEMRLFLLYTELQSQRDVAAILGVSSTTVNRYLRIINNKIKEKLKEYVNSNNDGNYNSTTPDGDRDDNGSSIIQETD